MASVARVMSVALIVLAIGARGAAAADCTAEATALRARLEHEQHRVSTWRWGWAIGFGAAAVGQASLAPFVGDRVQRDTIWLGAIKSGIGATARVILPVRFDVPARDADACVDLAHLHAALEAGGRSERAGFWLDHLGGFAVNAVGALVLAHYTNAKAGLVSFAIGYPVGLASTYTQPRAGWHLWLAPTVTPTADGATVGIIGAW